MKVLALDTAQWTSSVALWEDGKELAFEENSQERDQAVLLPSLVNHVLGGETVDLLLVNRGPGSFTGIRVGLAFAKGFSLGTSLPLRGISGFRALYESLETPQSVLVLIEAQRQDVFGQLFVKGKEYPAQSFSKEEIQEILSSPTPPLLAGSGVAPFLNGLNVQKLTSSLRGAQCLAHTFFKDKTFAGPASPLYARPADVTSLST